MASKEYCTTCGQGRTQSRCPCGVSMCWACKTTIKHWELVQALYPQHAYKSLEPHRKHFSPAEGGMNLDGFTWKIWTAPKPSWDHEHCIECWAEFSEIYPDTLREGYANDRDEWLCAGCYEKLKSRK